MGQKQQQRNMAASETFSEDYDITILNYKILSALEKDADSLPLIENEIEKLELSRISAKNLIDISAIEEKLTMMRSVRERYQNGHRKREYWERTKEYITTYKSLRATTTDTIVIDGEQLSIIEYRIDIIRRYLEIAGEYYAHNVVWIPDGADTVCDVCDQQLIGGMCPNCGTATEKDDMMLTEKSSQYYTINNFMKYVIHSMGEQVADPIDDVMTDMDEQAVRMKLISAEKIRKMPLDNYGRRGPYNMTKFMELMAAAGHSDRNKDKHLIIKMYWGWELYNVRHFMDIIKEDCIKIDTLYEKVKRSDKASAMNREYKYYKILQWHRDKLARPLAELHFSIISTDHILIEYEGDMKKICALLNDKSRPFIPLRGGKPKRRLVPVAKDVNGVLEKVQEQQQATSS